MAKTTKLKDAPLATEVITIPQEVVAFAQNNDKQKKDPRLTPVQTLVLNAMFLQQRARKDSPSEQALAAASLDLFKLPETLEALEVLKEKAYVDQNGDITKFGELLILTGCSPTPNLNRLAEGSFSSATAMLFAGGNAMLVKHRALENGIIPGKTDDLCRNLENLADDILEACKTGREIAAARV